MKQSWTKLAAPSISAVQAAEETAAQGRAYFDAQRELVDGIAEGESKANLEKLMGGLGLERTKQVVEERALQGKCGNFLCKNPIKEDMRNYPHYNAVRFISQTEVIPTYELDQYCSMECFKYFREVVLPKRPDADVWELQKKVGNGKDETSVQPKELVSKVKEREVVSKPKKKFNTLPNPDVAGDLARKIKKKSVTFSESVSVSEFSVEHSDEDDGDEGSEFSESLGDDDDDEGELAMGSFLDTNDAMDDKIEASGLSAFILSWDFLTRIVTDHTKEGIYGKQARRFSPPSYLDEDVHDERLVELSMSLRKGVDSCNFSNSSEFAEKATSEVTRIVPTFDLSRPIPKYHPEVWALISCVILGVLAEAGRFPGFDFERNDIVTCFAGGELCMLDDAQMEILKNALRSTNPS